jgi:hypothetical protein
MSRTARILIVLAPAIAGAVSMFFVPAIVQDQSYHQFADGRARMGIPNFGDVVSNLPFVLVGLAGLLLLPRGRLPDARERWMWAVFFASQLLTGLGSAWYHASPDDARLIWDRLPLTGVIMSLVAIVTAERIGLRTGWRLFGPLLAIGAGSMVVWRLTGDLRLYALVQFGPLLCLPLMIVLFPPRYTIGWGYGAAIGFYAAAKICELLDGEIYFALNRAVSGHTLKHLLAGAAAAALLAMAARRSPLPGNDSHVEADDRRDVLLDG